MKKVYIADTIPQAHLVASLLNNEKIKTRVENENLISAYGEIPPTTDTFPTVCVLEDSDYEKALKILERNVKGFKAHQEYKSIVEVAVEVAVFEKPWVFLVAVLVIVLVALVLSSAFG